LGDGVSIGPYSHVEAGVTIGAGTTIGNFTLVKSGTVIGQNCRIYHYCSLGEIPQDLKFQGEATTVEIGDDVTLREYVSINRGTAAHGVTRIGAHTYLMAYVHIAHDCQIGRHVIMANLATLGGHVEIGDWASLGGGVLVHQFTRVGEHVFVGGGFRIVQDVPPFILAAGEPLRYGGINRVGLQRRGFSPERRSRIKQVYRWYFRSDLTRTEALQRMREAFPDDPDVNRIVAFITGSNRGII
jgi:UDP-N-acetylglucosamine acyltransferase